MRCAIARFQTAALAATMLGLAALARAGDIEIGDPAAKVRDLLGEPRGDIRSGSYELLQYNRGRVELRDGVVTSVDLVSEAEAVARAAQRDQDQEARRARQAAAREQRRLDGLTARDRAIGNAAFMTSSGDRQVEFWDSFRRQYPDVPVDSEYAAALNKQDEEREKAATEQRLAAMEKRVQAAETKAQEASRDAERAKRESRRRTIYYNYPAYPAWPRPTCMTNPSMARTSSTVIPAGPFPSHSYTVGGSTPYVSPYTIYESSPSSGGINLRVQF